MIEYLESLDHAIVLFINGWNSPFLDEFMWIVSGKITWIPFICLLTYLIWKNYGMRGFLLSVLGICVCILVADLSSVHLFKEVFQRYRPSHNMDLSNQLHFYTYDNGEQYKGGMYGFVSSHSANFFSIGTFLLLLLRKNYRLIWVPILFTCALIAYSRVYLGVHYFSDVLIGGFLGAFFGYLVYRMLNVSIVNRSPKI